MQRLIKPYALPMLRVLLQKANDINPTVAANVLFCLGELVCIGAEDAMPHVPDLMQVIITRLSDPPSDKRDPHFVLLVKSAQAPVMLLHLSLIIPNCYLCWEGFYKWKSARQYVAKLSKFLGF